MQKKTNKHLIWLNDHLDWVKEDSGFDNQEDFDQFYKTLCPINMVDIISLEKSINDEIYEIDNKKLNFFKSLGFKIDASLREHYFYKGKYYTSYILSLLRSDYE